MITIDDLPKGALLIVVSGSDWNAFGHPSLLAAYNLQALKQMGGVSASVPPGHYVFSSRPRRLFRREFTLTPLND